MAWKRSARWLLLALVVIAAKAQAQDPDQIPPGTVRTGPFVWDGVKWEPVEAPPPPAPVAEVITVAEAPQQYASGLVP